MDEEYYNWIHFSEQGDTMHDFQQGDKVLLTEGWLSGRVGFLQYYWFDTGKWTVSLMVDGVEALVDVLEKDMEFVR